MPFGINDQVIFGHDDEVVDDTPSSFEKKPGALAQLIGKNGVLTAAGEAALFAGTGALSGMAAPFVGMASDIGQRISGAPINKAQQAGEASAGQFMQDYTYQPRSERGQVAADAIGEVVNQIGIPMLGVRIPHVSNTPLKQMMPEINKPVVEPARPPVKDIVKTFGKDDPVVEPGKQGELFPQTFEPGPAQGLTPEAIAELQRRGDPQADMFSNPISAVEQQRAQEAQQAQQAALRQADAQAAIEARLAAQEQAVKQQTTLDLGAADRARQEQAPTGFADWQHNQALAEAEATHQWAARAHQMEIDDHPHGMPGDQFGWTREGGRIDENGIPIRADRSMEAQQLQSPLQRNLWGDEMPRQSEQEGRPLTEAIDRIKDTPFKGDKRDQALERFGLYRGQGGAIDIKEITDAIKGLKDRGSNVREMPPPKIPVGEVTEIFDKKDMPKPNLGIVKPGQRGVVDVNHAIDGIKMVGESVRRMFTGETPPKVDTILRPASPDNIAKKEALRRKAEAINLKDSPYEHVNTIEEALTDPGKDISNNAVRNSLTPGVQSMVRHSTSNKILKFARDIVYSARNAAESFSRQYITNSKEGIAAILGRATEAEKQRVAEVVQELSRKRIEYTDAIGDQLQLTPKEKELIESHNKLMGGMLSLANEALVKQGFEAIKEHVGYSPNMFSGAYTTILRKPGEKGQVLVAQADTKYGMQKAIEYYKEHYPEHTEAIELPRKGLKDTAWKSNRVFNGFDKLVQVLADNNPDFAEAKSLADAYAADNIKKLFKFDVHEKRKTGARGSLGDRPWLDQKTNTKQFWEGVVSYGEEGARYYSYQDALNQLGKLQTEPALQASHPNTLAYLAKYTENLQGKGLNNLGAVGNQIVDLVPKVLGVSPKYMSEGLAAARTGSSILMMGGVNLGFLGTQLTQLFTGGLPEMMKIRGTLGLEAKDIAHTFVTLNQSLVGLMLEGKNNKASFVPEHMRNAWNWAHDHGMFDFNEAVMAKEALENPIKQKAVKVATVPMWLGEKMTRPPVFMMFTDMFHKAGYEQERAFKMAQEATDYAMANYHPDERAMLYSNLGAMGSMMGALSTFKHNLLDQWYTRTADVKKGEIAPALAMVGMVYGLYGLSGMPGYQEADKIVTWATGKTIRDIGSKAITDPSVMDGVLSVTTGLDFSSRLSMASILPDDPLSTFPHISNTAKIIGAAIDYAKHQDVNSAENLAYTVTPSGMKGMLEKQTRNDEGFVLNKNAQHKYDTPRTEGEWNSRQIAGIRPLKERIDDEQTYAHGVVYQRQEKQRQDLVSRINIAARTGDLEAARRDVAKFIELGGDPNMFNEQWFAKNAVDSKISEKQRRQGMPTESLRSINRYKAYN